MLRSLLPLAVLLAVACGPEPVSPPAAPPTETSVEPTASEPGPLVVSLEADGLVMVAPDGRRVDLGSWPPGELVPPITLFEPLFEAVMPVVQVAAEPPEVTVVLPAGRSPTASQAKQLVYTLNKARVGPIRLLLDPGGPPLGMDRALPPPPEPGDRGPIEQVRVTEIDLVLFDVDAGLGAGAVLRIEAIRPGGPAGLVALVGDPESSGDPWSAAERAAWRRVQLADAQGCTPLTVDGAAREQLAGSLADLLRPYELSGARVLVHVDGRFPLADLQAIEQRLASLGIAPFGFHSSLPPAEPACEDPVRTPEELFAALAEQRAAAEALAPTGPQ